VFDSESWGINKRDAQEMSAKNKGFLKPLMDIQITNRLTCSNVIKIINVEDLKVHQKYLLDHLKRMDMN
jgi:hypothetical protein